MNWNGHMNTGGWIFMIFAFIVILALVAAIAWSILERRDHGPATTMSASEILDGRLASGNITVEQYERLRRTLGPPPGPDVPRASPPARSADAGVA